MDKRQTRAFEGFAAESGAELLRIATLLTPDPHTAEDVYQETLQRLAARWPRVDNPKAFCRRVMQYIVVDQARARSRRPHELRLFDTGEKKDQESRSSFLVILSTRLRGPIRLNALTRSPSGLVSASSAR
jgi:DNA-directed RNA polymerase specialized sigma24 family protein